MLRRLLLLCLLAAAFLPSLPAHAETQVIRMYKVGSSSFAEELAQMTGELIASLGDYRLEWDRAGYTRMDWWGNGLESYPDWLATNLPKIQSGNYDFVVVQTIGFDTLDPTQQTYLFQTILPDLNAKVRAAGAELILYDKYRSGYNCYPDYLRSNYLFHLEAARHSPGLRITFGGDAMVQLWRNDPYFAGMRSFMEMGGHPGPMADYVSAVNLAYLMTGIDVRTATQSPAPYRAIPHHWLYENWWLTLPSGTAADVAFYNTHQHRVSPTRLTLSETEAATIAQTAMDFHLRYSAELEAYRNDPAVFAALHAELQAYWARYGDVDSFPISEAEREALRALCTGQALVTPEQLADLRTRSRRLDPSLRAAAATYLDAAQLDAWEADFQSTWLDENSKLRDDTYFNSLLAWQIAINTNNDSERDRLAAINTIFERMLGLLGEVLLLDRLTPAQQVAWLTNPPWPAGFATYAPNLASILATSPEDVERQITLRRVYLGQWLDENFLDAFKAARYPLESWLLADSRFYEDFTTGNYAITRVVVVDNTDAGFSSSNGVVKPTDATTNNQRFGTNYVRLSVGATYTATWAPDFTGFSGSVEVLVRFPQGTVLQVPYTVTHAAGTTTVRLDQNSDGGVWRSLGTYRMVGSGSVRVSGDVAGTQRINVDAARFVKTPDIAVTGIQVLPATLTLATGTARNLVAAITPTRAYNRALAWSSSAPAIATITPEGRVSAVAPGTATLVATTDDGSHTATCTLSVVAPEAGFLAWQQQQSFPPSLQGASADADGDGRTNFGNYALPADPAAPARDPVSLGIASERLEISFPTVSDPGLIYEVWASTDLSDWGSAPIWSGNGAELGNSRKVVTSPLTLDAAPRQFLRVKVRHP